MLLGVTLPKQWICNIATLQSNMVWSLAKTVVFTTDNLSADCWEYSFVAFTSCILNRNEMRHALLVLCLKIGITVG